MPAAPKIDILTISGAACDNNFVNMKFVFQWMYLTDSLNSKQLYLWHVSNSQRDLIPVHCTLKNYPFCRSALKLRSSRYGIMRAGGFSALTIAGIILYMRPANERRRYIVTPSLIGWAHTQNDPCLNYACYRCGTLSSPIVCSASPHLSCIENMTYNETLDTHTHTHTYIYDNSQQHDDVIKWSIFCVTCPWCGEFTGHRWIPLTKGRWRGA